MMVLVGFKAGKKGAEVMRMLGLAYQLSPFEHISQCQDIKFAGNGLEQSRATDQDHRVGGQVQEGPGAIDR